MRWLLLALCLLGVGVGASTDDGLVRLPPLQGRVNDLTATLSPEQRASLENRLARLEADRGLQVAVLLLPSTQPETIEQFGIRLAEAWKIGRRGVNDGIILVVAKNDHRMRIEVGYGLEGAVPDAIAKRIVAEQMAPRFKQGDFVGGIEAAVEAIATAASGESLPPPPVSRGVPLAEAVDQGGDAFAYLMGALFFSVFARRMLGLLGVLAAAGVAGWAAWMLAQSWLLVAIAIAVASAIGLLASAAVGWPGRRASGRWGSGGSGWSSGGGSWSSGSSGGSSSGGGFSGGGGDFGGGGASGDW